MNIITTKVLVALLFGIVRFLFGMFPVKVNAWLQVSVTDSSATRINENRRETLEFIIALVQAFGGGVLFATCFLHMMPEVYDSVQELKEYGVLGTNYPYSQLVISLGFFTIYFAEEISQWLISRAPKEPIRRRIKSDKCRMEVVSSVSGTEAELTKIPNGMAFEIENKEKIDSGFEEKSEKYFLDDSDVEVVVDNVDEAVQTENEKNLTTTQNLENNLDLEGDVNAEIEEIIEEEVKTQQQILRCFLMVLALSFHAVFEGLAIGLQRSVTSIWYLFTAVCVHSATILFCIGLEIVLAGAAIKTMMIHMGMLSATSPFGVLLGLIITLTTDLHTSAKSFAIVLLEGLSAGTILYITFFETLSREKQRRKCRILRAVFIGAGFTMMALLQGLKMST